MPQRPTALFLGEGGVLLANGWDGGGNPMKKMLLAIDDSDGSWKAVDYVSQQFAGVNDLKVTLFHVLVGLPPQFWDDGHFLTEEEKTTRKTVIDKWLSNQHHVIEPLFNRAIETLMAAGVGRGQIETKFISESVDAPAQCILAEAKAGGYRTLVVGRCGHSVRHLFMGGTASTIVNAGAGMVICVAG